MKECLINSQSVPEEFVGELRDSSDVLEDGAEICKRIEEDGFVFLRSALDTGEVLSAREEVLERLVAVEEIRPPAVEGIATGKSRRKEMAGDLGTFWQSVCEGPLLRQVTHGEMIRSVLDKIFSEPSVGQDYIFLRIGVSGRITPLHYDRPFFARGSNRIVTTWFPLGDVPVSLGPLMVIEGSNQFSDLIGDSKEIDYHSKYSPRVTLDGDTVALLKERRTRILTADFKAGDMVIFGMKTLHGSLDNNSPEDRVRVSVDVRYQPSADPKDERYFGSNPGGTTGVGYGELNGAKPLTEPWHIR